jgi:hypothetical protein
VCLCARKGVCRCKSVRDEAQGPEEGEVEEQQL